MGISLMSEKINLHVGSIEDMGKRFIDTWHKLEQGEAVDEIHLTTFNLETRVSTLSPKRPALQPRAQSGCGNGGENR